MNEIATSKIILIGDLVRSGASLREIMRAAGVAKQTAMRHKRLTLTFGGRLPAPLIRCACGRTAGHRGWCDARVAKSPARQAFLANWNRA